MSTHALIVIVVVAGLVSVTGLVFSRVTQLWFGATTYRTLIGVFLGAASLVILAGAAIAWRAIDGRADAHTRQAAELRTLKQQVRQACREGASKVKLVEVGLRYPGDAVAPIDSAHQLLFYGEPWLRLCGAAVSGDALIIDDRAKLIRIIEAVQQQLP